MTNLELILNTLAEATTVEISKSKKPKTFRDNAKVANQGGEVAGNALKDIESKTGKKVITGKNAKQLQNKNRKKLIN